jgi:hypothetical protein
LEHHAAALAVATETGARDQQGQAHTGLAEACRADGDLSGARQHYQRALTAYGTTAPADAARVRDRVATLDSAVTGRRV